MGNPRKIFFVMAGGGQDTDRHHNDAIKNRRSISEFKHFLKESEANLLSERTCGRPCAVWGAIQGPSNIRNWDNMQAGDYVMVYREGKTILPAEMALKIKNPELASYFWEEDDKLNFMENDYVNRLGFPAV